MKTLTKFAEDVTREVKPGFIDPLTALAILEAVIQAVRMFRECQAKHASPKAFKAAHPVIYEMRLRQAVSRSLRNHGLPQEHREAIVAAVDRKVVAATDAEVAAFQSEADENFPPLAA